jgi:ketosteroid isomerase-like protein
MRRDTTTAGVTSEALQLDSVTVRVYGDAAVAQASGTLRGLSGGPAVMHIRNTDVFVWRDGRWQIVATHLSRVPGPQGRSRTP